MTLIRGVETPFRIQYLSAALLASPLSIAAPEALAVALGMIPLHPPAGTDGEASTLKLILMLLAFHVGFCLFCLFVYTIGLLVCGITTAVKALFASGKRIIADSGAKRAQPCQQLDLQNRKFP